MSEEQNDLLFDLLTTKAIYGLDEAEERQLAEFDPGTTDLEFRSLEITAAAITMAGLETEEQMPSHLFARILDSGEEFVLAAKDVAEPVAAKRETVSDEAGRTRSAGSWFGWLGWAAAAAACIALAINIWVTRVQPPVEVAKNTQPPEVKKVLSPAEMREELLRSSATVIKANWTSPDPKKPDAVSGDVVWSEEKQVGYMRFRGLPVNDSKATCYQLWIFDKTQDEKTPIDGGTFDVTADGEVIVPINAKLKALGAKLFAITVEKPGGVVVSKREKIAAIAKVET